MEATVVYFTIPGHTVKPGVKTLSHNSRYQAGIRKMSLEYKYRGQFNM
jgi:hypothetical protein